MSTNAPMHVAAGCRLLVLLPLLALSACERSAPPPPATPAAPATAGSTRPTADELANVRQFVQDTTPRRTEALPAGHPPIGDRSQAAPTTAPRTAGRR